MIQNEFSLLDTIPVEILVLQKTSLDVLFINQAGKVTYGLTEQGHEVVNYLSLHPEEEQAAVSRKINHGKAFSSEQFHHYLASGTLMPVEIAVNSVSFGPCEVILVVARQTGHTKVREKYLSDQLEYFREAKRLAAMGRWDYNHEKHEFHISDTLYPILGIPCGASPPGLNDFFSYIHDKDKRKVLKNWNETIRREKIFQSEHRIITQNGETRWVSEIYKTRMAPGGDPLHTTGIVQDITSRKKNENALAESEEKFRQLADNINELCWLTDVPSGKVIYKNPAFIDFFGDNTEEKSQSLESMFARTIKEDLPGLLRLADCSDTGKSGEAEIRFLNQSKQITWFVVKVRPVTTKKGSLCRHVGIAYDVTALKNAEYKLKEALEVERKMSEMKSGFVSMASHEFKTPLSNIMISADLIRQYNKKMPENDLKKHTSIIISKVESLSNLINKVLDLSCIESGKIPTEHRETDIAQVLRLWCEEKHRSHKPEYNIRCICPEYPVRLICDDHLLIHVLDNLLSNAVKYSPVGTSICIKLRISDLKIIISIADHGFGISPDEQDYLFDPFYRSSRTRQIPGTGMGLPVVKKITESLNGKIRVKSMLNKGTVFFIELPCIGAAVPALSISE